MLFHSLSSSVKGKEQAHHPLPDPTKVNWISVTTIKTGKVVSFNTKAEVQDYVNANSWRGCSAKKMRAIYSISVDDACGNVIVYNPNKGTRRFKDLTQAASFLNSTSCAVGKALKQQKTKGSRCISHTVKGYTVSDATDPSTASNHNFWRRFQIKNPATGSTTYATSLTALAVELLAVPDAYTCLSEHALASNSLATKLGGLLRSGTGQITVGTLTVVDSALVKLAAQAAVPYNRYLSNQKFKLVKGVPSFGSSSSNSKVTSSSAGGGSAGGGSAGGSAAGDVEERATNTVAAGSSAGPDADALLCNFGVCDIDAGHTTTTLECKHEHCTACMTQWEKACASYINTDYGEGFAQPQVFTCPSCRAAADIKAATPV